MQDVDCSKCNFDAVEMMGTTCTPQEMMLVSKCEAIQMLCRCARCNEPCFWVLWASWHLHVFTSASGTLEQMCRMRARG